MDYSLGECIAYQVTDFSEGDFSKFGNAVRKGAIIGAMGLATLAPAKAMSIEDQIKADTRAYTTAVRTDTSPLIFSSWDSGVNSVSNPDRKVSPSKMVDQALSHKDAVKYIDAYQTIRNGERMPLKEAYSKEKADRTIAQSWMKDRQLQFEKLLDEKTKSDSLAGKVYKANKEAEEGKSVGDHLKDAWNSTSEAAKKTGEKVSEKAGEAWNWMKGVGSKIADKISGSKNSDKEFSEGDFGVNLDKIINKARKGAIVGLVAGTAAFGGWAGNKVGGSNLAIPKAQRTAIVQMEKAADNYDADAAIARLTDINLAASGKAVENTGKSKAYNVAADTLREEAKSVRNKATKTSRGWGTFLGSLAGAAGGAGAIGAAKRKKKENELIDKYMKNSSSAGTP